MMILYCRIPYPVLLLLRLLLPVLYPDLTAAAQPPSSQGTLPMLVETPVVAAPEAAPASRLAATVRLELKILSRDDVLRVEVRAPAGHDFDGAALDAVRNCRFELARDTTGIAVRARTEDRYAFTLEAVPVVSLSG